MSDGIALKSGRERDLPADEHCATALADMVEDLRSLALQCRGLALIETRPEAARALVDAADEYDSAAERLLAEASPAAG